MKAAIIPISDITFALDFCTVTFRKQILQLNQYFLLFFFLGLKLVKSEIGKISLRFGSV